MVLIAMTTFQLDIVVPNSAQFDIQSIAQSCLVTTVRFMLVSRLLTLPKYWHTAS